MSHGLNARFKLDPVAFLSSYWDINSSQPQHGEGYGIDPKGIAYLDLAEYSAHSVMVSKGVTGIFASMGKEAPIKAYYLASSPNASRSMQLGSDCDYFFTDTITGCQFCVYGNNRHNVRVSHTNALNSGGAAVYGPEAKAIRECNYPITAIYGPPNYRAGLNAAEQKEDVTVTVIGWRRGDGWHFYTKRRFDDTRLGVSNHRALDNAAYEI